MGLRKFCEFERLYEARMLNEGDFDRFARDLAAEYKADLVKLNPLLAEYQKVREGSMKKRVQIGEDLMKETDSAKKEKLNNDLVKVNKDEEKKLEQNAKKLAEWGEEKAGILKFLMKSRLEEINHEVLEDEYRMQQRDLSDTARKRYEDMLDSSEEALKARAEKMEKLMDDYMADTRGEDEDIEDAEKKRAEAEADYDASGDVSPAEKKAQQQKQKRAEKGPLSEI